MRYIGLALLVIYPTMIAASELDDWSIDGYSGYAVSLRYGVDEEENTLQGVSFALPFFAYGTIDAFYTEARTTIDAYEAESDQHGLTWFSDPMQTISIGFGYEFTGTKDIVEIQDNIILGRYSANNRYLQFKYISGEITAYTIDTAGIQRPILRRLLQNLGDSISIDRDGYGIETGLETPGWDWNTGLTIYKYSRNLSRIRENLTPYYLKSGVINQVMQLSNWDFFTNVLYLAENHSLLLGLNIYEAYVEAETEKQVYANIELPISNTLSAGAYVSYLIDSESLYSEVSLGIYW